VTVASGGCPSAQRVVVHHWSGLNSGVSSTSARCPSLLRSETLKDSVLGCGSGRISALVKPGFQEPSIARPSMRQRASSSVWSASPRFGRTLPDNLVTVLRWIEDEGRNLKCPPVFRFFVSQRAVEPTGEVLKVGPKDQPIRLRNHRSHDPAARLTATATVDSNTSRRVGRNEGIVGSQYFGWIETHSPRARCRGQPIHSVDQDRDDGPIRPRRIAGTKVYSEIQSTDPLRRQIRLLLGSSNAGRRQG
jgi:hypothetical protein